MSWQYWTAITTNKNWFFTEPSQAQFFRIRHELSEPAPYGFKGLICRANFDVENIAFNNFKRIYPSEFLLTLNLPPVPVLNQSRIGVKGQTKFISSILWTVHIEVWLEE